ncbi:MAG: hypothetical protein WCH59_04300 [Chitinophagia bacterium]
MFLFIPSVLTFGQKLEIKKGQKRRVEISFSINQLPVNVKNATIDFQYFDGKAPSIIPIDTIKSTYNLQKQIFNTSIGFGISYYFSENIFISFHAMPHLNSFLSNKGKDGKVYGAQIEVNGNYEKMIGQNIFLTSGIGICRILGGYGITSGGPSAKPYLYVNQNKLYDQDIGFHIIDNSWAAKLQFGVKYRIMKGLFSYINLAYQFNYSRASQLNFAGIDENAKVLWNKKSYDDADLFLKVNGQRITNNNFSNLPFTFDGLSTQFRLAISL